MIPLKLFITDILNNIPNNYNTLANLDLNSSENLIQSNLDNANSEFAFNSGMKNLNTQLSFGIFSPLFDLIGPSLVANLILDVVTLVMNSLISSSQLDITNKVNNANLFNTGSNTNQQNNSSYDYNPSNFGTKKYSTEQFNNDVVKPGFEQFNNFNQFINENPDIYNIGNKFNYVIENVVINILNINQNSDNQNNYLFHAYYQFAIATGINVIGHFVSLGLYGLELNDKSQDQIYLWLKIAQTMLDLSKISLLIDGILTLSNHGIIVPEQFFIELTKNFIDGLVTWWTGFKAAIAWILLISMGIYAATLTHDNWSFFFALVFIYKSFQEAFSFYLAERFRSSSFISIIGLSYMISAIGDAKVIYDTISFMEGL